MASSHAVFVAHGVAARPGQGAGGRTLWTGLPRLERWPMPRAAQRRIRPTSQDAATNRIEIASINAETALTSGEMPIRIMPKM
jgi:hypothetical protein